MKDYSIFCIICAQNIQPIVSFSLIVNKTCKLNVHAASDYKDPIKSLILAAKFDHTACILLAQLIWKHSCLKNIEFDYLVPIPLHWTRYAFRGFNQAHVIAKELSKLSKKETIDCLTRLKKTKFQSSLSGEERKKNLSQAFKLKKQENLLKDKIIVLVDDLMTTGSTLQEAAKVLKELQPKEMHAIVACRVNS